MTLQIDPVAAGVVVVAFIFWLAGLSFMTRKNAADITEMRGQIKTALDASASLERLSDAVRYGNEALAQSVSNLAEKVAEHASYAKDQFVEIRSQMKHDRANAAMAESATRRARSKIEAGDK